MCVRSVKMGKSLLLLNHLRKLSSGLSKLKMDTVNRTLIVPATAQTTPMSVSEMHSRFAKKVGAQSWYSSENNNREHLFQYLPKSQDELPPRRMLDSYDTAIIPLGSDPSLREKYMTYEKTVRVGRLLEDLDIFAVWLGYKHTLNPKQKEGDPSPYSIVTALVDQIDFATTPLQHDADILLRGHVTWVGKSSIETTMEVDQRDPDTGKWRTVTNARFVMVARDPLNKGAALINPLSIETDKEEELFRRGEFSKERRLQMQTQSLFRQPPSEEERLIIHDLFLRTVDWEAMSFQSRLKPESSVWMADAKLKNLIICQPENRNLYNKIFGGFLMRQAMELAWANCYTFCQSLPIIIHVDDILFRKPVEIGSLLYFSSQVVYCQGEHVMVRVSAEVVNAENGKRDVTNVFYFTFQSSSHPPEIIPKTYEEAMLYLEGRRHYQETALSHKRSRSKL